MDTWPETREKLSATVGIAQALYMRLVEEREYAETIANQLLRGQRQPELPFFAYQCASVYRPSSMAEDPESGEFLPVTAIAEREKETLCDLGYRSRVAVLTQSRFANMSIMDALSSEFPCLRLLEAMCGPGYRVRTEKKSEVSHNGYKTWNNVLVLEFNTAWFEDVPAVCRIWPDANKTQVDSEGNIKWPPSMGAPVLLPSQVDIWRQKIDALWVGRSRPVCAGV